MPVNPLTISLLLLLLALLVVIGRSRQGSATGTAAEAPSSLVPGSDTVQIDLSRGPDQWTLSSVSKRIRAAALAVAGAGPWAEPEPVEVDLIARLLERARPQDESAPEYDEWLPVLEEEPSGPDPGVGAEPELEEGPGIVAEATLVPEPEATLGPEPEATPVPEPEATPVPEPQATLVPEPEMEVEMEIETVVDTEREVGPVMEAEAVAGSRPEPAAETEPDEPETGAAVEAEAPLTMSLASTDEFESYLAGEWGEDQTSAYLRQVALVVRGLSANTSDDENPHRTLARVAAAVERLAANDDMARPVLPLVTDPTPHPRPGGGWVPAHRREVPQLPAPVPAPQEALAPVPPEEVDVVIREGVVEASVAPPAPEPLVSPTVVLDTAIPVAVPVTGLEDFTSMSIPMPAPLPDLDDEMAVPVPLPAVEDQVVGPVPMSVQALTPHLDDLVEMSMPGSLAEPDDTISMPTLDDDITIPIPVPIVVPMAMPTPVLAPRLEDFTSMPMPLAGLDDDVSLPISMSLAQLDEQAPMPVPHRDWAQEEFWLADEPEIVLPVPPPAVVNVQRSRRGLLRRHSV